MIAPLLCLLGVATSVQQDPVADRWRFFFEQRAVQELWLEVSQANEPRTVLFEHANLVPMTGPTVREDVSLLVEDGRIAWVGPPDAARAPDGALRVDARGKYLFPGLADMHVHRRDSPSQALVSLAHGVTTEREMCGFPWELAQRERLRDGTLLAPDLFVASHILNSRPMGVFATVVTTPEHARRFVDDQVAQGFDFIKVHNNVEPDVYHAVFERADELGVRVVGHVPQESTLKEALALGHHTLEHFKGYILDGTLELTTEDYVALTDGSGAWNCPTLATRFIGMIGDEAYEYLDTFEGMAYVSVYDRERWYAMVETRDPRNSHARVWELSRKIFVDLLQTDARFLAGTDSGGGYENHVPGAMLPEELRLMEELGLPTFEVLQAATVNAALALETDEFGTLEVGKRADLLLLKANPLETVANLRRPDGVMARGVWLARETIDEFLDEIATIYAHSGEDHPPPLPTDDEVAEYLGAVEALHAAGFVFVDGHLDELAGLLHGMGRTEDGTFVQGLRTRRGSLGSDR